MARARVAVVATTAETVEEDTHRALGLVGRAASRHPRAVIFGAAAPAPGLPGAATKPWQLQAWRTWQAQRGHPEVGRLMRVSPDDRVPHSGLRWAEGWGLEVKDCDAGEGALSEVHAPVLTATWSAAPRRGQWEDSRAVALASLIDSGDWGLRGATALLCDAQRARRPWPRPRSRPDAVAELMRLHREDFEDTLCVLDATVCGSDSRHRRPMILNLVLASVDPVAVDSVAAAILGWQPRSIPWLARLGEEELGVADLAQIECVGGGLDLSSCVGGLRPWRASLARSAFGVGRVSALTRLGEVCGRVYHALLWKPWVGRPLAKLYDECPWGRLDAQVRSSQEATR